MSMHIAMSQALGLDGWWQYEKDVQSGVARIMWGYRRYVPVLAFVGENPHRKVLHGIVLDDGSGYSGAEGQHPGYGIWGAALAQIEKHKAGRA
jgi:hypothetical protein